MGQHIRDRGNEYGTVTRRPRRCGWFDAVAARYTARLSGVDSLAVMLLDVLGELPELKICTAYELDGRRVTDFPSHVDDLRRVVPVYETLPGWQTGNQRRAATGRLAGGRPDVFGPARASWSAGRWKSFPSGRTGSRRFLRSESAWAGRR